MDSIDDSEVLAHIQSAGFTLAVNASGDKLLVEGPKQAMTPDLADSIRNHKADLIAYLMARSDAPSVGRGMVDSTIVPLEPAITISWADDDVEIARAYETKPTVPGGVPPYQHALAQQQWLASIDWRNGLHCGITGEQCRLCKGVPCNGSTQWRPTGEG